MIRISDQARENREYVRRLLKEKQPGFAALLESAERLLCPMCPGERCFLAAAQGKSRRLSDARKAPHHAGCQIMGGDADRRTGETVRPSPVRRKLAPHAAAVLPIRTGRPPAQNCAPRPGYYAACCRKNHSGQTAARHPQ